MKTKQFLLFVCFAIASLSASAQNNTSGTIVADTTKKVVAEKAEPKKKKTEYEKLVSKNDVVNRRECFRPSCERPSQWRNPRHQYLLASQYHESARDFLCRELQKEYLKKMDALINDLNPTEVAIYTNSSTE